VNDEPFDIAGALRVFELDREPFGEMTHHLAGNLSDRKNIADLQHDTDCADSVLKGIPARI
jgi:hypothetical protein